MKVKILGSEYDYPNGTSLYDISLNFKNNYKYSILAGYVNNELCDLSYKVMKDADIRFIDYSDRNGSRIYQKSLIYLLVYSVYRLYGNDRHIRVCHSIDKGIRIRCDFNLTVDILNNIENDMKKVVSSNILFQKKLVKKKEAIEYFNLVGNSAKVSSLKYITNHYVNLYKFDNIYEYFYSVMPYDSSVLGNFQLFYLNDAEFILQFPSISSNLEISAYINRPKILEAFNDNYRLSKRLKVFNVCDLNKSIAINKINDIIKLCEVVSNNSLLTLAKNIYDNRDKIKIVLIAGPSSSGKTTSCRKLSMFLKSFGLNPTPLSIDDYFLDRVNTPKLENGEFDYESINAIDINLFNKHLTSLLNNEEVITPTYDFYSGEKRFDKKMLLKDNDILVIEGLHGLNEQLTSSIPRENKYKIYVSPLTDLNIDNYTMISTSDVRLLRRIVRDNRTRGYTASDTIKRWSDVRSGEEKYVFPFQDDADFVFNSALVYELGVLKIYAEPLLYEIDESSLYYEEARRLLNILSMFLGVSTDVVPEDSILREFIGKSYFEE